MPCILLLLLLSSTPVNDVYQWREIPHTAQYGLLRNDRQIGSWHTIDGYYRALHSDGTWGPREERPPISPPKVNFGLVEEHIRSGDRYRHNGKDVTREQVQHLIASARIPDHADKWRLTIIGAEKDRTPVLKDLAAHAGFAQWKDRLIVSGYDPDHWHVARVGFHTTGKPTIYLQDARGMVLHRQDDYVGGAESLLKALNKVIEKRRVPDPNYDPKKDPDTRKDPSPLVKNVPWSVWLLVGGAVLLILLGRRTA